MIVKLHTARMFVSRSTGHWQPAARTTADCNCKEEELFYAQLEIGFVDPAAASTSQYSSHAPPTLIFTLRSRNLRRHKLQK